MLKLIEQHFNPLPWSFLTKRAEANTLLFTSKHHKHEPDITFIVRLMHSII